MSNRIPERNPLNIILGVAMMVLVLYVILQLASFVFELLWWASPVIFIAALLVDFKGVLGYGKWLVQLTRKNPLSGIIVGLLSVVGFPLVSLFLLGRGLFRKRIREAQQTAYEQRQGEFVDYEELDSEPLQLPEREKREDLR